MDIKPCLSIALDYEEPNSSASLLYEESVAMENAVAALTTTANGASTPTTHKGGDDLFEEAVTQSKVRTYHAQFNWFESILLLLCLIGILGNILNLLVLTKRRFRTTLNNLESSANYGLVALAVTDLCFCLLVMPHVFLPGLTGYSRGYMRSSVVLAYKVYGISAINLFQMTSTWIIIIIAINRWIVVMYPLRAKQWIDKKFTVYSIIGVFFLSILLTLPHFCNMTIRQCYSLDGQIMYEMRYVWGLSDSFTPYLAFYLRWIWPIFANFLPLIVLSFCNVQLVFKVKSTMRQEPPFNVGRRVTHNKMVESKVTVTLLSIVLMYLLLVTPGEIIRYINPFSSWGETGLIVAKCLNLTLTANFAFNFLLYCAVNASFRQTVREMLRPRKQQQLSIRSDHYKRIAVQRGTRTSYKTEASIL